MKVTIQTRGLALNRSQPSAIQLQPRLAAADQLEIDRRQEFHIQQRAVKIARGIVDGKALAQGIEAGRSAGKFLPRQQ